MAHSFWKRMLYAAANERLPDPPAISPQMKRILSLLEDPTKWTRDQAREDNYTDLLLHGPCDITVEECSYMSSWYHVDVGDDRIDLNETEESALAKALHNWRVHDNRVQSRAKAKEKMEREDRINQRLGIHA